MDIIRNEKDLIYKAFDPYGLHHYTSRIWAGYERMKMKKRIFVACHIEGEEGVDRDYPNLRKPN